MSNWIRQLSGEVSPVNGLLMSAFKSGDGDINTPSDALLALVDSDERSLVQSTDTPSPQPAMDGPASKSARREPASNDALAEMLLSLDSHLAEASEDDKPQHSYIALISMAILSSAEKKLLLCDIYQWIMDHFSFYKSTADKSWRNSIRHNLSLNECFVKMGRSENGKGHFWAIHPACFDDFARGDFRRRQARRRARRATQMLENLRSQPLYVPMEAQPFLPYVSNVDSSTMSRSNLLWNQGVARQPFMPHIF